MSELKNIVIQISELENSYRSEGDSDLHRCAFLADMFGVDLQKSDYTSLTELKAHMQTVATNTEQEMLVEAINRLNNVEILLKNYNSEIKSLPSTIFNYDNLEIMLSRVSDLSKDNTRSINADYLDDLRVTTKEINTYRLNEKEISRVKPHTELGLTVGALMSDIYTVDDKGKAIAVLVKDKLVKVSSKQFFSFQAKVDIEETMKALTKEGTKGKALKKILSSMLENGLAVRDEIFITVSKEDLDKDGIKLTIGRRELKSIKPVEVIKGLLYRTEAVIPNPMAKNKLEAWVVVL